MGLKRRSRQVLRWRPLWSWEPADSLYFSRALGFGEVIVGCSDDAGAVAIAPNQTWADEVWRYPVVDTDLLWTSVSCAADVLTVGLNIAGGASRVAGLDARGHVHWEHEIEGAVRDVASDARFVHVHAASADADWIQVLDAHTGKHLWRVNLAGAPTARLRVSRPGRVSTASGRHVVELDSELRMWSMDVEATELPQGRVVSAEVDADGATAVIAEAWVRRIDREGAVIWHTECPGRALPAEGDEDTELEPPDLGPLLHDRQLGAYLVCDLNGSLHCIGSRKGELRWSARGLAYPTAQTVGRAAVLRADVGTAVGFPGADENLYLVDPSDGHLLDRYPWPGPIESELCPIDDGAAVVVPGSGLFAFGLQR
jgi:outer membrane protein assembly factor BamB